MSFSETIVTAIATGYGLGVGFVVLVIFIARAQQGRG